MHQLGEAVWYLISKCHWSISKLLHILNGLSTQNAFKLYDKDSSGQLCSFELRQALNSAGYRLNNHICDALMLRYGDRDGKVSFDDFIMCSVKLKTMMGK